MNEKEIYRLCDYLINSSRYWHLEYAKRTLIDSEYNKIVKERDKFDKLLKKRVDDLLNDNYSSKPTDKNSYNQIFNEDVLMVKCIKVYTESNSIELTKDDYTKEELEQVIKSLEEGKDLKVKSFYKDVFLDSSAIKGYEVEHTSSYENHVKKHHN